MFQNIFSSVLRTDNEQLLEQAMKFAKRFKMNPNDIHNRVEFKLFCQENKLPMPEFPPERKAFIEPFEIVNWPPLLCWLNGKKVQWHEHNGLNQYHINCKCRCDKQHIDCAAIPLTTAQFNGAMKEIKYRGQLFVWNKTFRECLPTKIDAEKIQLIQTVGSGSFIYVPLNNPNVQN